MLLYELISLVVISVSMYLCCVTDSKFIYYSWDDGGWASTVSVMCVCHEAARYGFVQDVMSHSLVLSYQMDLDK